MSKTNFSIFTAFKAKDGLTPVFKHIVKNSGVAGISISTSMMKAKTSMLALKSACATVSTAIAAVGAFAPLKAFSDWEKGLKTVYTLLNKDEISKFGATLGSLSKEGIRAGLAVEDVNTALFNSVSAMGMSNNTIDIYKKSLILAKGGAADLSTSLSGMAAVINAWGAETTNSTNIANAFFTAQKNGVTTVQELASNIGTIAPIASKMGLSAEETMASIAALTKGGLSTDAATTALKSTLQALLHPTKQAEETLRAFGVPIGMTEVKTAGLTKTLQKLIELQKKSPNAIAKAIPNIRALTGVLAMDENKMQEVHRTLGMIQNDIKNGTGLNEAFDMMNSTGATTMARVVGELKVTLIELGEIVAPYLLPVIKTFGEFVHTFSETLPDIQTKLTNFINMAHSIYKFIKMALIPTLSILSGLIAGLVVYKSVQFLQALQVQLALLKMQAGGSLLMALKNMTIGIIASTRAILTQNLAFMASPLFWIPAVIVGIITLIILLVKNWDKITVTVKNWYEKTAICLKSFWNNVKEVFGNIRNFIKAHFIDVLFSAFSPIGAIIMGLKNILNLFENVKSSGGLFKNGFNFGFKENNSIQPLVKTENYSSIKGASGVIEVKNIVENKNNSAVSSYVSLLRADNLMLNPS